LPCTRNVSSFEPVIFLAAGSSTCIQGLTPITFV
jgi:hypothetical protein